MARKAADRRQAGQAAEDAALAHLQGSGLALLARNVRYPFGEIDLVMLAAGTVAFVEVRLRRSTAYGGAAVSVDAGKRRRLALAAQAWLGENRAHARLPCRFDVVAVTMQDGRLHSEWIPAAFTLDDLG
jgi:putative endonuclease